MTVTTARIEDLLVAVRDIISADSPRQVEASALNAVRSALDVDAAVWLDLDGDELQVTALVGLIQPEAHQNLRISSDSGVSGRVLARDEPAASADFAADSLVRPELRELLHREGVVSIAGAPLQGQSGPQGVLIAMTRHRREFDDQQLRVLLALAGIAQVLRQQSRAAEARSNEAVALNERANSAETLQHTIDALATALLRGKSDDNALAVASDVLGTRLHVEGLPVPGPSSHRALSESEAGSSFDTGVPIPGADRARLIAEDAISEQRLRTLAQVVALNFARRRASVETEIRLTDHFVHSLLVADTEDLGRLWRHSSLLGMNLEVPRALVCIGGDEPADRPLLDRIQREMRERTFSGQVTAYDGDVILLWPVPKEGDLERLPDQIREVLRTCRPRKLTAGVGPVCRAADDYPAAVREAMFARQVATYSSSGREIARSSELGMYRLFAHIGGIDALRGAVLEALGPLLEADQSSGSDLVHTLRVFLDRDRRIAETARALYVHVNTLRYRIERITKLLGIDLDDAEERFFITLAMHLFPIVQNESI